MSKSNIKTAIVFSEDSTYGLDFWIQMCRSNIIIGNIAKLEIYPFIDKGKPCGVNTVTKHVAKYMKEHQNSSDKPYIVVAIDFLEEDTLTRVKDIENKAIETGFEYCIISLPSFESAIISSKDYIHRGNYALEYKNILIELRDSIMRYCVNGCSDTERALLRQYLINKFPTKFERTTVEKMFKRVLGITSSKAIGRCYRNQEDEIITPEGEITKDYKIYKCLRMDCEEAKVVDFSDSTYHICERCPYSDTLVTKLLATTKDSPFSIIYDTNIEELKPWIIRNNYANEVQ